MNKKLLTLVLSMALVCTGNAKIWAQTGNDVDNNDGSAFAVDSPIGSYNQDNDALNFHADDNREDNDVTSVQDNDTSSIHADDNDQDNDVTNTSVQDNDTTNLHADDNDQDNDVTSIHADDNDQDNDVTTVTTNTHVEDNDDLSFHDSSTNDSYNQEDDSYHVSQTGTINANDGSAVAVGNLATGGATIFDGDINGLVPTGGTGDFNVNTGVVDRSVFGNGSASFTNVGLGVNGDIGASANATNNQTTVLTGL